MSTDDDDTRGLTNTRRREKPIDNHSNRYSQNQQRLLENRAPH